MKDYLTLRLPAELAHKLARWAKSRRLPKSAVVREAVARYLAPTPPPEASVRGVSGQELAARWASLPHLTAQEASDLARDIAEAREALPPVPAAWD